MKSPKTAARTKEWNIDLDAPLGVLLAAASRHDGRSAHADGGEKGYKNIHDQVGDADGGNGLVGK